MQFNMLDIIMPSPKEQKEIERNGKKWLKQFRKEQKAKEKQQKKALKQRQKEEKAKEKQQKKAAKQGFTSKIQSGENLINLSQEATTGASINVQTASLPGTAPATLSVAPFLMICTALLLCASTAVFYRKRQKHITK